MKNSVYFEDSDGRFYYLKNEIYIPIQINNFIGVGMGRGGRGPRGLQGPAGESGANAPNFQTTAIDDITTSSQTDVVATGMTLTPPSGTYLVWFSGSALISSEEVNADEGYLSIYSDGLQIPSSEERFGALPSTPAMTMGVNFPFNCIAKVTVDGNQAIEGRWRVNDDSIATMHQRNLTLLRVAI